MILVDEIPDGSNRSLSTECSTGQHKALTAPGALSPTSTAAASARRVRFCVSVVVNPVLHVFDYTDAEYMASWYSPKDYKRMRKEIAETVERQERRMTSKREDDAEEGYCMRGLEACHGTGSRKRKQNKRCALEAVLEEQELQREEGILDAELMADIYYGYSNHCLGDAHLRGLQDQEVARELNRIAR